MKTHKAPQTEVHRSIVYKEDVFSWDSKDYLEREYPACPKCGHRKDMPERFTRPFILFTNLQDIQSAISSGKKISLQSGVVPRIIHAMRIHGDWSLTIEWEDGSAEIYELDPGDYEYDVEQRQRRGAY